MAGRWRGPDMATRAPRCGLRCERRDGLQDGRRWRSGRTGGGFGRPSRRVGRAGTRYATGGVSSRRGIAAVPGGGRHATDASRARTASGRPTGVTGPGHRCRQGMRCGPGRGRVIRSPARTPARWGRRRSVRRATRCASRRASRCGRPTAGRAGTPAGAPAAMPHDPQPTARNAAVATAGRDVAPNLRGVRRSRSSGKCPTVHRHRWRRFRQRPSRQIATQSPAGQCMLDCGLIDLHRARFCAEAQIAVFRVIEGLYKPLALPLVHGPHVRNRSRTRPSPNGRDLTRRPSTEAGQHQVGQNIDHGGRVQLPVDPDCQGLGPSTAWSTRNFLPSCVQL